MMRCQLCKHEWNNRGLHFGTKRQVQKERCPQCNSDLLMKVFPNLLSQVWWDVRTKFEAGAMDLDPADEELAEQLLTIRWEPNSKGQIVIKYADGPSPNRADALMLAHAPEPLPEAEEFITW
jgi:DNA-directed RNA polymerase subunit RPC12/RpoP